MAPDVRRDPTAVVALVVALACMAGTVWLVPSVLPRPLRELVGLGPHRLAPVVHASGSRSYAFLAHQPGRSDEPVGYDPCHRIALRINPRGAPPGGVALVRSAMREVEQRTGLRFDYQGTTDQRPRWRSESVPFIAGHPRTSPALVAWARPEEVPELAGDVAGIGGSLAVADSDGVHRFVTGGVTLDEGDFASLARVPAGVREERAIVLHELGHLVGLAHVHDPGELMNADNVGRLDFGPGDLAGLAAVGATSCD